MSTRQMTLCSMLVALLTVPVLAQQGPNSPTPEAIAHHCRVYMTRIAIRTTHQMHRGANHCIGRINHLLEEGEEAQAAEAAAHCIESINGLAEHRSDRITMIATHCVERLTELEAPQELIDMIEHVGETRVEMIATRRAAEVQRIEDALAG